MAVLHYLIWAVLACGVRGYSTGAPYQTCLSMYPKHRWNEEQTGPPPINITFTPPLYSPGQNIAMTITAMTGHVIRGIQIRAHRADVNLEDTVGTFVDWPDHKIQPISCFGELHNMVTHRHNDPDTNITLVWKAPGVNMGDIVFTVSLVESYQVYWATFSSPRLPPTDPNSVLPPAALEPEVNATFEPINWSECGKSKGCLLYPRHCSGSDCYAAVTFTKVAEEYTFELFVIAEGYVSLGFSHDEIMGHDQTITCTAQGPRVMVQNGYNHNAKYNERLTRMNLSNLRTMQKDGAVYCRFTRPQKMDLPIMPSATGTPDVFTFDLDLDYFLFLAWGDTYQDSDTIKIHTELPLVSDNKVSFRRYSVHRGSIFPFQPKVHGCVMVVAWIGMAGVTVVLSRYFREGVGAALCLGLQAWFQLHRLCAILVFGLTTAGLVLILVYLKGEITENEETYDHACVGFTVVALVCAQVLMGFLRPSPTFKFRFLFNWLHRILGKAAQILSAVTMLLAFQWKWIPKVARDFGVTVLGCWIGAQVLAEILLEVWHQCRNRKTEAADINLDDLDPREKMAAGKEASAVPLLLYLLVPLTAVCAALCAILLF